VRTALPFALAVLSVAGPALAEPRAPTAAPSVVVRYADLDLRQAKDAAVMLARIQRAAADACQQASGYVGNDTETILRVQACYRQSVARAVGDLNASKVSELLRGRAGDDGRRRHPAQGQGPGSRNGA
jgi:UrcA family protein